MAEYGDMGIGMPRMGIDTFTESYTVYAVKRIGEVAVDVSAAQYGGHPGHATILLKNLKGMRLLIPESDLLPVEKDLIQRWNP